MGRERTGSVGGIVGDLSPDGCFLPERQHEHFCKFDENILEDEYNYL